MSVFILLFGMVFIGTIPLAIAMKIIDHMWRSRNN